jgi:hypothetical protein
LGVFLNNYLVKDYQTFPFLRLKSQFGKILNLKKLNSPFCVQAKIIKLVGLKNGGRLSPINLVIFAGTQNGEYIYKFRNSSLEMSYIKILWIWKPFIRVSELGRNKLNLKRVGMIFDLDENYTNYSLNLPPSFGDNVKSAGPP